MRPVGSDLEREGESGVLARIGYLENLFLFGLFALSLGVAFFENERQSGAEMLAGPIALGLAVTIALRARLPGVLGVVLLSLFLLALPAFFSVPAWEASRFSHALSLVGVIAAFASFAGFVVAYHRRSRDLPERGRKMPKMFDALPVGVWVRARDGRTIFVNERWASFSDRAADVITESADRVTAQGHSKRPDAIIGVAAGNQEIPADRLRLAGIRAVIGEEPESQELRALIREVSEGEKN